MYRCSVLQCNNSSRRYKSKAEVTYHFFPKDPVAQQTWVESTGRPFWAPSSSSTICSEHFDDADFIHFGKGDKCLRDGAIPVWKITSKKPPLAQEDTPDPHENASTEVTVPAVPVPAPPSIIEGPQLNQPNRRRRARKNFLPMSDTAADDGQCPFKPSKSAAQRAREYRARLKRRREAEAGIADGSGDNTRDRSKDRSGNHSEDRSENHSDNNLQIEQSEDHSMHNSDQRPEDLSKGHSEDHSKNLSEDHFKIGLEDHSKDRPENHSKERSKHHSENRFESHSKELAKSYSKDRPENHSQDRPEDQSKNRSDYHSKERTKSHFKDRPENHSKNRLEDRSRSHSKERPKNYSKDRTDIRSKDHSKSYSADRPKDHSAGRPKDHCVDQPKEHSVDRSKDHTKDSSKSYSTERPKDNYADRPKDHSLDRPKEHSVDRPKEHSKGSSKSNSVDHSKDYSSDQPKSHSKEHSMDRSKDHPMDRLKDHPMDRPKDLSKDRSKSVSVDRSRDNSNDNSKNPSKDRSRGNSKNGAKNSPQESQSKKNVGPKKPRKTRSILLRISKQFIKAAAENSSKCEEDSSSHPKKRRRHDKQHPEASTSLDGAPSAPSDPSDITDTTMASKSKPNDMADTEDSSDRGDTTAKSRLKKWREAIESGIYYGSEDDSDDGNHDGEDHLGFPVLIPRIHRIHFDATQDEPSSEHDIPGQESPIPEQEMASTTQDTFSAQKRGNTIQEATMEDETGSTTSESSLPDQDSASATSESTIPEQAASPTPKTALVKQEPPSRPPETPLPEQEAATEPETTPAPRTSWPVLSTLRIYNQSKVDQRTTMFGPSNIFDFDWVPLPYPRIHPKQKREVFTDRNWGPSKPFLTPYDAFTAIWDREIMEYIANETNKYAQEVTDMLIQEGTLKPKSRFNDWQETDADELYIFFALLLASGLCVKSHLKEYWMRKDILSTPNFAQYMSQNRFMLLCRCLHFVPFTPAIKYLPNAEAKVSKLEPIINHLNSKFQSLYRLGRNIVMEESLTQWKGALDMRHFIKNKVSSVGVKTYELSEAQTGYLWRFKVYAGEDIAETEAVYGLVPTVVLELLSGLEHKGRTVWMDNNYTSPALARVLKSKGFDCVGILKPNRPYVPKRLAALAKSNMPKGKIASMTSGDLDVLVWSDRHRMTILTTYHGDGIRVVDGKTMPVAVLDYNLCMAGVDRKDQMLSMYPLERTRTRVWYKKLFRRLLNASVLNAYILHKHSVIPQSQEQITIHREFRRKLVRQILLQHKSRPVLDLTGLTRARIGSKMVPNVPVLSKDVIKHFPTEYGFIHPTGQKKERIRRSCVLCHKRVHTYCPACNVALCPFDCIQIYHQ